MSTNLIFPAPSLQQSASRTLSDVIATRLGRPAVPLKPTLSSTSLGTSLADPNTTLESSREVTQIGGTSTATESPSTTASLIDRPTPEISSITLNAGSRNSGQESGESHSALIVSSIALAFIVMLVIASALWFIILCRRRKRRSKSETDESVGYLDKERGVTYERDADSMSGEEEETREGVEDLRRNADAFDSLNMVADRSVITSMASSQFTRASNPPPPPYGNGITDSGGGQIDGVQVDTLQRLTLVGQSTDGGQPPRFSNLSHQNRRTMPGAEASFAALARLLPPMMTVQCTFTPASPDEMEVKKGDKVQITGVFDDGWCLCKAESGRVGVVPLACLDIPESAFTSSNPVRSGLRVRNVDVPRQKEEENREVKSVRELVPTDTRRLEVSGREGEENGRLVMRSPRLSSLGVAIVQNGLRDDK